MFFHDFCKFGDIRTARRGDIGPPDVFYFQCHGITFCTTNLYNTPYQNPIKNQDIFVNLLTPRNENFASHAKAYLKALL